MAFLQRRIIPGCLALLAILMVAGTRAQSGPENQPPLVMFRVLAIGDTTLVDGLFYENNGKSVRLTVGDTAPSPPYQSPPGGMLTLYREQPPIPPETKPRRIPVATAQLGEDVQYWVVLLVTAQPGGPVITPLVVSDSWENHPFQTIRVLNFTRRQIAVQVEGAPVKLAPTETHAFPYPGSGRETVRIKAATLDAEGWEVRVNTHQGILPNTRASLVLTDVPRSETDPTPEALTVTNMVDFLPPPKNDRQ